MKAKVICFGSAKGGSGKTIISASLAQFLGALGKKVLLVDMDAATNGLSLLYLEELNKARKRLEENRLSARGIFEALTDKLPTPFPIDSSVDLIPAVYMMKQTEGMTEQVLMDSIVGIFSAFRNRYDYIIVDAQAGSDMYAQIAIENADEIVLVSEYDPVSAEGVERLKRLFPRALPHNKTWILFNKILPEFAQSLGEFLRIARYLNPIPWDAEVVRAFARRKLALDTENGNEYTVAIMQMASSLLGDEIQEDINLWKQDKEDSLREPARQQFEAIEEELSLMEQARIRTEYDLRLSQRRIENTRNFFITILVAIIVYASAYLFFVKPELLLEIVLTAAAVLALGIPFAVYTIRVIERRFRKKAMDLESQIKSLSLRVDDLKERRQKYKIIVESDLKTLLDKYKK